MTTYKRLGDYIRPIDVRNWDLKINLSQGICNAKYFQNPKQVADNPQTHKVVRTGQFAYNRATTRNGEKISIALREGPDCTVSSAYQVFDRSRYAIFCRLRKLGYEHPVESDELMDNYNKFFVHRK